jgi:hypothetical protein|tara:strand:- start:515 stop:712 length:198 start_codon:yes stop_codon:yes gene_type:complete
MNEYQREVEERLLVRAHRTVLSLQHLQEFLSHNSSKREAEICRKELMMALNEYESMMFDRDEVQS